LLLIASDLLIGKMRALTTVTVVAVFPTPILLTPADN